MEFLNYYKNPSTQHLLNQMAQKGELNNVFAQKATCLHCGRPLSQHEMFPRGHASRAMCNSCYVMVMHSDPSTCIECGCLNPAAQAQVVRGNPREIFYRLCSDNCKAKWAYKCGLVAGIAPLALPSNGYQQCSGASNAINVPLPGQPQPQQAFPPGQNTTHVPLPGKQQGVPQSYSEPEAPAAATPPQPQNIVVNNYTVHVHSGDSRSQNYSQGNGYDDDIIDAQVIRSEPLALPEPEEQIVLNIPRREYDMSLIPDEPAELPKLPTWEEFEEDIQRLKYK